LAYTGKGKSPLKWQTSDADILLLLNALERLVLLSVSNSDDVLSSDAEVGPSEKSANETSTGLLGYVFGSDNAQQPIDERHLVSTSRLLWPPY
jgi:hypothetical protein